MMFSPDRLSIQDRYKLLTGSVVPRFIAWVATRSLSGVSNLAPFSYATIAGHAPTSLLFVVAGRKPDGTPKDSLRNARPEEEGGSGAFVVHVVDDGMAVAMAKSAAPLDDQTSEISMLGLRYVDASRVAAPRLVDARMAFECVTTQLVKVGVSTIVVGEVVAIHAAEGVVDDAFRVDAQKLDAIGRMAGSAYCRTTDRFSIEDGAFFPRADGAAR